MQLIFYHNPAVELKRNHFDFLFDPFVLNVQGESCSCLRVRTEWVAIQWGNDNILRVMTCSNMLFKKNNNKNLKFRKNRELTFQLLHVDSPSDENRPVTMFPRPSWGEVAQIMDGCYQVDKHMHICQWTLKCHWCFKKYVRYVHWILKIFCDIQQTSVCYDLSRLPVMFPNAHLHSKKKV